MSFPVTFSNIPIVVDTLPALKIQHYYGEASIKKLYTYARLYVLQGILQLSLYCFEKTPSEDSHVVFSMAKGNNTLTLTLTPSKAYLLNAQGQKYQLNPVIFSSSDEQGWYWGAHIPISRSILEENQFLLPCGSQFTGALFHCIEGQAGFGSCFEALNKNTMLSETNYKDFSVVPY